MALGTLVYAGYNFVKTLTLIAFCLAFAVKQNALINDNWNQASCDHCYIKSQNSPTQVEFADCSENYRFNGTGVPYYRTDKLLYPRDGFFDLDPISSCHLTVTVASVALIVIICLGCIFLSLSSMVPDGNTFRFAGILGITSHVILISAQYCFFLVLDDGCYVGVAGSGHLTATNVFLGFSVLGYGGNKLEEEEKDIAQIIFCCQGFMQVIYGCLVLVIGVNYSSITGDPTALIITLLAFLSQMEAPILLCGAILGLAKSGGTGV